HHSVHPYRTREIHCDKAEHALVGIDGRLLRTPVGPFSISVEESVINFIIPE
ncbi:MAG: lipid kinase, partial [Prevotella sp.]|nr:lipid kinase [Prevotella sp.]